MRGASIRDIALKFKQIVFNLRDAISPWGKNMPQSPVGDDATWRTGAQQVSLNIAWMPIVAYLEFTFNVNKVSILKKMYFQQNDIKISSYSFETYLDRSSSKNYIDLQQ